MRVKKMSALALVVAAAGLSLTACGSSDGAGASADAGASTSASSSNGGQKSDSGSSSSGSGADREATSMAQSAKSGAKCKTDDLDPSAAPTGGKNEIVVNLKNSGSNTCTMRGFPGVQLVGPDGLGDTGPDAARTDASGTTQTIAPGEETQFLLHYLPAPSDSDKKTYTRLSVTPPDERVSTITDLKSQAITIAAPAGGHSPDVYVDPIGYHTGSGK